MNGRFQLATRIIAVALVMMATSARGFWIIDQPDGSGMMQPLSTIDCSGTGLEDDYADLFQFKYNTGMSIYQSYGWTDTPTLDINDIHAHPETGDWQTTAYPPAGDYGVGNYKLSLREGETECDNVVFNVAEDGGM